MNDVPLYYYLFLSSQSRWILDSRVSGSEELGEQEKKRRRTSEKDGGGGGGGGSEKGNKQTLPRKCREMYKSLKSLIGN